MAYPQVHLLPGQDRRLRAGHPWAYSNELRMDAAAKALPPGEPVCLVTAEGQRLALAQFNPHSLIAARLWTRNTAAAIDRRFLERRLARALRLRERLFERPCYRLVHAEADGLPGLVVDRFGDVLVCQLNSAGIGGARGAAAGGARAPAGAGRGAAAQRQPGARARGPGDRGAGRQGRDRRRRSRWSRTG